MQYDREPGREQAEYAVIVEDGWQDQGLGIASTRRLVDVARGNTVRRFYAIAMGENRRMLELLRQLDLPEQAHREKGVNHVDAELLSPESFDERDRGTDDI